jgi:hypothetical protein
MSDGGATQTNLTIRRIIMGVPQAPTQQIAHGLSATTTFTLQVDYIDNSITATISAGAAVVTLAHSNVVERTFVTFRSLAIASDVNGATVDRAQSCELVRDYATIRDALVAIADDGSVYANFGGDSMTPIASRVIGQSGQASIDQYLGTVYVIGGGKARKIDLVNRTTTPWTATSGNLPGYTAAGTTDGQVLVFWGTRAVITRSQANPNGIYYAAINDPDDWNTGSRIFGAAFVQNMPEPVVALMPISDQQLLVCCERSAYMILGDPGIGSSETIPVLGSTGASGPTAVLPFQSPGGPLVHSPEGVYLVRGNTAISITKNVLTQYAEIPRDDLGTYTVSVVRDPSAARVHIFITPTSPTVAGTHLVYEEAVGGFDPNGGGWFLDKFPASFGPTATAVHKGKIYMGGHDGIIRVFRDSATTDAGTNIDIKLPVRVIHQGLTEGDVFLQRTAPQLTDDSTGTVTVKLFAGATAQQVMNPTTRTLLWSTTFTELGAPITRQGRDSALLLEFSSTAATWAMQQVDIVATPMMRSSRRVRNAVAAGLPCTYPTVESGDEPTEGGEGPGAPGEPSGGVVLAVDETFAGPVYPFPMSPLLEPDPMGFAIGDFGSDYDNGNNDLIGGQRVDLPNDGPDTFSGGAPTNGASFGNDIFQPFTAGNDSGWGGSFTPPPIDE